MIEYQLSMAIQALYFYADPSTYFAISILGDRPCGELVDDISDTHIGFKPGKLARETFKRLINPRLRMRIKRKYR